MRTRTLGVMTAMAAVLLTTGWAQAQSCASDDACSAGEMCLYPPCAAPCDPEDESCEPAECAGVCVTDEGPSFTECESDDECDGEWVCEIVGGTACAGVVCPDGVECPDPEPCVTEDIRACVPPPPAPCTDDTDCDEGLVCVTYNYVDCPPVLGRDCPPGSDCPEPEPVECSDETESYCVPSYFAPCEEDDDCGPGFLCVEGEMCGCSGGGSTGGGTGVDPGGAEPPAGGDDTSECFCEPTGELYCELDEMPCLEDAECLDGFVCEALAAPSVPCTFDSETGETVCDEPVDDHSGGQCVPAGWQSWVGAGPAPSSAEDYDETLGAAVGGDAQAEGRASENANAGGSGGSVGSGGSAGGCAVTNGSAGLGHALLFALALVIGAAVPRRRVG